MFTSSTQLRYRMEDSLLNDPRNSKIIKDNLQWVELERRPSMSQMILGKETPGDDSEIFIPGSGIAKQLYNNWYECVHI